MTTNLSYIMLSYALGVLFLFGYGIWLLRYIRQLEKRLHVLGK